MNISTKCKGNPRSSDDALVADTHGNFMKRFDGMWEVGLICPKYQRTNSGLATCWVAKSDRGTDIQSLPNIDLVLIIVQARYRAKFFRSILCSLTIIHLRYIHSGYGKLHYRCCYTALGQTGVWLPMCNRWPLRPPPDIHWHSQEALWARAVHESQVALQVLKWEKTLWHIAVSRELGSWYLPWQALPF